MQYQNNRKTPKLKVTININIKIKIIQGTANPRYKTTLCKKFSSGKICPYGDKCQFAHGSQELRMPLLQNQGQNMGMNNNSNNKSQHNYLNYKIVKCKNWEKDHTCKYGAHCTFAHGDADLRNKADNLHQMNNSFPMMMPLAIPPGMSMSQMQQVMLSNQLMMGLNPGFQNQNQNVIQGKKEIQDAK